MLLLPFALACGPPPERPEPLTRFAPGGGAVLGTRVVYLVEEHTAGHDGRLFLVSCPTGGAASPTVSCDRQVVGLADPVDRAARLVEGVRNEVVGAVSEARTCPREEIAIQSGTELEGFWVAACGAQRFFQWDGATGAWVDRTP